MSVDFFLCTTHCLLILTPSIHGSFHTCCNKGNFHFQVDYRELTVSPQRKRFQPITQTQTFNMASAIHILQNSTTTQWVIKTLINLFPDRAALSCLSGRGCKDAPSPAVTRCARVGWQLGGHPFSEEKGREEQGKGYLEVGRGWKERSELRSKCKVNK